MEQKSQGSVKELLKTQPDPSVFLMGSGKGGSGLRQSLALTEAIPGKAGTLELRIQGSSAGLGASCLIFNQSNEDFSSCHCWF